VVIRTANDELSGLADIDSRSAAPSAIGCVLERFPEGAAGSFSIPAKPSWLIRNSARRLCRPFRLSSLRALAQRRDSYSLTVLNPALPWVLLMPFRDDIWLHSLFREHAALLREDEATRAARGALLYRDKTAMKLIWKNRSEYRNWDQRLFEEAQLREDTELPRNTMGRPYERRLSDEFGAETRVFWLPFKPLGGAAIPLTDDKGEGKIGEIFRLSPLTASLKNLWKGEPKYYVVLLGSPTIEDVGERWLSSTVDLLATHTS